MYRSIRLYILHKFGCEKCYQYTQRLVEELNENNFRVRLMMLDGNKKPEDIEFTQGVQSVCMYLMDGKFKYYLYDGYDKSVVNSIESIVSTLQEATEFYANLATKYSEITSAIFNVQVINSDIVTEFSHKYFHQEPYEITYIIGFDPSVSDEDKNRVLNLMYEEASSFNEDIEYKYNIETKIKQRGCQSCQSKK
jgi:hypothetical protein